MSIWLNSQNKKKNRTTSIRQSGRSQTKYFILTHRHVQAVAFESMSAFVRWEMAALLRRKIRKEDKDIPTDDRRGEQMGRTKQNFQRVQHQMKT